MIYRDPWRKPLPPPPADMGPPRQEGGGGDEKAIGCGCFLACLALIAFYGLGYYVGHR